MPGVPGLFILTLLFSYGGSGITSNTNSDFKYSYDACVQAGEVARRQQERVAQELNFRNGMNVSFICVPVMQTIVNVPPGAQQGGRQPNFFPGDYQR